MQHVYAQIDGAGIAVARSELAAEVEADNLIPIPADFNPFGHRWTGSTWEPVSAATQPALALTITADKPVATIDEAITITAELHVPGGPVAPVDATFAVPIEDPAGLVVKIKGVQFVQGVATVQLSFATSGYYRLTEAGINRKLPPSQRIALPEPLEITIFE